MLTYEDVGAASDWLCAAFGFREQKRYTDDDGRVTNTILAGPNGGILMPGWTGPEYENPRHHAEHCDAARHWRESPYIVDGVLVTVANVDEHYRRAQDAGAMILSPPEDTPVGRHYRVEDCEGHRWMFSE
jgi:uncharacterized glyoxalase superfamily protein PhnB